MHSTSLVTAHTLSWCHRQGTRRAQRGYDEVPDEPVRLLKGLGVIAQSSLN